MKMRIFEAARKITFYRQYIDINGRCLIDCGFFNTGLDYGDGSDDELKRLAMQIDDGIYDPLASLQNVKQEEKQEKGKPNTSSQSIESWIKSVAASQTDGEISAPPITPGESRGSGGKTKTPQVVGDSTDDAPIDELQQPAVSNDPLQSEKPSCTENDGESAQPLAAAENTTDEKSQGDKQPVDETTKGSDKKGTERHSIVGIIYLAFGKLECLEK